MPIDIEPLLQRCRGRRDFAESVLLKFRGQSVETLEAIVRGLKEKNGELTTRSAHSLKGMAATVSAEPLRQAAADAEAKARAGHWDAVQAQLEEIRRQVDACVAFIPSVLAKASDRAAETSRPQAEGERAHSDRR